MAAERVLVTGASGFIAKHCIAELIRRGHEVRATLRNPARKDEVITSVGHAGADASNVEFVQADLLNDEGWDAALSGCQYVLHVASPFPLNEPRSADDLIRPAREGTLRVLQAATRAGVKRVVQTSSIVATSLPWPDQEPGYVFSEEDWSNPKRPDVTSYVVSKTLAEMAAWDFVKSTPNAPELATVNPALVLGPAVDADISSSHEVLRLMAIGAYPAAPRIGFPISDVRDVAVTHALAMTSPKAAGQRFLSANGFMHLIEIGRLMTDLLPDLKAKVPRRELPDWVVRAIALFDRRLKPALPELAHPRPVSNAKAHKLLEQSFHSPQDAVKAAVNSLRALHVI